MSYYIISHYIMLYFIYIYIYLYYIIYFIILYYIILCYIMLYYLIYIHIHSRILSPMVISMVIIPGEDMELLVQRRFSEATPRIETTPSAMILSASLDGAALRLAEMAGKPMSKTRQKLYFVAVFSEVFS